MNWRERLSDGAYEVIGSILFLPGIILMGLAIALEWLSDMVWWVLRRIYGSLLV